MTKTTALCISLLLLAGCGIKPSFVDAPQGVEHDRFPHVYPDPAKLKNDAGVKKSPAAE